MLIQFDWLAMSGRKQCKQVVFFVKVFSGHIIRSVYSENLHNRLKLESYRLIVPCCTRGFVFVIKSIVAITTRFRSVGLIFETPGILQEHESNLTNIFFFFHKENLIFSTLNGSPSGPKRYLFPSVACNSTRKDFRKFFNRFNNEPSINSQQRRANAEYKVWETTASLLFMQIG